MTKNYYIAHVMDIFALADKEKVDVGIGFEMFRNEHRAKLAQEITTDGEIAAATEYGEFVTANYDALCRQFNAWTVCVQVFGVGKTTPNMKGD